MTIFLGKGGIVFKGGHYIREDIIQGNTVHVFTSTDDYNNHFFCFLLLHSDFENVDNDVKDAKFLLKRQFKICLKC